jgi:hypothetical protein
MAYRRFLLITVHTSLIKVLSGLNELPVSIDLGEMYMEMSTLNSKKLGEILVAKRFITFDQLMKAIEIQK